MEFWTVTATLVSIFILLGVAKNVKLGWRKPTLSKISDKRAIRALGLMERYYWAMNASGTYCNFIITIDLKGKAPSVANVQDVLRILVNRHPSFQTLIVDKENSIERPYFIKLENAEQKMCR